MRNDSHNVFCFPSTMLQNCVPLLATVPDLRFVFTFSFFFLPIPRTICWHGKSNVSDLNKLWRQAVVQQKASAPKATICVQSSPVAKTPVALRHHYTTCDKKRGPARNLDPIFYANTLMVEHSKLNFTRRALTFKTVLHPGLSWAQQLKTRDLFWLVSRITHEWNKRWCLVCWPAAASITQAAQRLWSLQDDNQWTQINHSNTCRINRTIRCVHIARGIEQNICTWEGTVYWQLRR